MEIRFEGWWQCRFATDPDPSDDPRGVSGPTFTTAGEPVFDRIIRFQSPLAPRWPFTDTVGVTVRAVAVHGEPRPHSALVGQTVDLRGDPQFHQRNLVLVEQPFQVIIDPFDLQVGAPDSVMLRRKALWDVTRPDLGVEDVFLDEALIAPRMNTVAVQSPVVAEATGILDYAGYRRQRLADLVERRGSATDPVERAALDRRITALDDDAILTGVRLAGEQFLGMQVTYDFALDGTPEVLDPAHALGGTVGTSQTWGLSMWWGGYDVDTLCGYVRGTLSVPFVEQPETPRA
ncbi:MAG TPA: hypothetical protein VFU25_00020 [Ornithinibacter sp.]|nr:hypothetical protein [Ornithinibacter sp.]